MHNALRMLAVCFVASLCTVAQEKANTIKVVLPSPQLIHCHSVACSQLWKQDSGNGAGYPSQVLTDFVNGEIVGLTAVYDKSVSTEELRSAIDTLYPNANIGKKRGQLWRVEAEQIVIQLFERNDGTKQLIYLKIAKIGGASSLVPAAHIMDQP